MSNQFQIDNDVFDQGVIEALRRKDELTQIRLKMRTMTLEENAEYADLVCRTYGTNEAFVDSMIELPPAGEKLELKLTNINASGVGGIAYLCLHAPREDQRNYYLYMYNELKRKNVL